MTQTQARTLFAPAPTVRRLHGGVSAAKYHSMHFLGALFPLGAGIALYGWRALAVVVAVMGSAALTLTVWRGIGARGRQLSLFHTLWLAMLLSLMLPAQLATASRSPIGQAPPWPLLVVAGMVLVIVLWLLGGLATKPVHASVVTFLLLLAGFSSYLEPRWVLAKDHVATGDLLAGTSGSGGVSPDPWLRRTAGSHREAFWSEPPTRALTEYTTGRLRPDRGQVALHALLRDRMPPLEDLTVGGQPATIGLGSAIAVIIGGLFLLYRGLIDFRIPLLVIGVAFVALLILPVPTVIREHSSHFRWLALREPDVRWETAVTFVNYELMASPTLFVAFFLATAAPLRPLSRRARVIYSVLLGIFCAAGQLYLSASYGPYVAVLVVGFLSPMLDGWFRPRALV